MDDNPPLFEMMRNLPLPLRVTDLRARAGTLAIHPEQRRMTRAGRQAELTARKYEPLRVLSLSAGRVFT